MKGQMSIFDLINLDEMYDGYRVRSTKTIENLCGCRIKLVKDTLCYLITRHSRSNSISIAFPNKYGGSFGFTVTDNQFYKLFEPLNKKIYPISKEIWDGKAWINNPSLN